MNEDEANQEIPLEKCKCGSEAQYLYKPWCVKVQCKRCGKRTNWQAYPAFASQAWNNKIKR